MSLPSGLHAGPEQCGQSAGLICFSRPAASSRVKICSLRRKTICLPSGDHSAWSPSQIRRAAPLASHFPHARAAAAGRGEEDRLSIGTEDRIDVLLVRPGLANSRNAEPSGRTLQSRHGPERLLEKTISPVLASGLTSAGSAAMAAARHPNAAEARMIENPRDLMVGSFFQQAKVASHDTNSHDHLQFWSQPEKKDRHRGGTVTPTGEPMVAVIPTDCVRRLHKTCLIWPRSRHVRDPFIRAISFSRDAICSSSRPSVCRQSCNSRRYCSISFTHCTSWRCNAPSRHAASC